jgi:hypothetical protein
LAAQVQAGAGQVLTAAAGELSRLVWELTNAAGVLTGLTLELSNFARELTGLVPVLTKATRELTNATRVLSKLTLVLSKVIFPGAKTGRLKTVLRRKWNESSGLTGKPAV